MYDDLRTAIEHFDRVTVLWINSAAGKSTLLDRIVFDIADSDFLKGGVFLALYWALWFAKSDDGRAAILNAILAAAVVALISRLIQVSLPFHPRPLHASGLPIKLPLGVDARTLNDFSSFPSDHAVLFFGLCVPLWRWSRLLALAAGFWTLLVICLPRIYLGYHWPSDVLGGLVIGVPTMIGVSRLIAATALPDRLLALSRNRPAIFYGLAFALCFEVGLLFLDVRHVGTDVVLFIKQGMKPSAADMAASP